jgi:uncharacterized protein (DUF1501 family)
MGCSAAIAAMAGSRLTHLAFADPDSTQADGDVLLAVFLRGGWDCLNVVPVIDGPDRANYEAARTSIKVPTSGTGAALRLDDRFGLHPAMAALHGLYQDKKLAVVHAVGLHSDTRSHFDAMQYIELGTPGSKTSTSGWITRHLQTSGGTGGAQIPSLAAGSSQPMSLAGSTDTAALSSPSSFKLHGHWKYVEQQQAALRTMYNGNTWLHSAGINTLNVVDAVDGASSSNYTPANGAMYPNGGFGDQLKVVAQMIKLGVGLRAATVDLGGWDTHENQGDGGSGYLANLLTQLSNGLVALYTDLNGSSSTNYTDKLSVTVMSEFGRRLRENNNRGTDHGHGSAMLVLGGGINGGKVYGNWPGLATDQLYDRADLAVTTDYRQVLGEIVMRRLKNNALNTVFPNITYAPLGIAQGTDQPVTGAPATATPVPTETPPKPLPSGLNQRTYLPLTRNARVQP